MTMLTTKDILTVIIILVVSTFVSSIASFSLKKASPAEGSKLRILVSPFFYLGGVLYVFGALGNIVLLQMIPYAIVLPLGSLTYIWTMLLSNRILKEKITVRKITGMCVIIIGVVLVALGKG